MRMSDTVDTETMKVSEAADTVSSSKDNTTKTEILDQSEGSRDDHRSNNKKDGQPVKYSKSNPRLKLVRSLAVCEESFPSSIAEQSAAPQDGFLLQPFEKEERSTKDQHEKEDGCDKEDRPEKTLTKMLSRDSSQDYTDSTGIDLHEFLVNTLKSNPRDRIMLLKLEQDILDFISNNESQERKFPPMTSYHRMLLHRVAAYFGMDHNVDPSGKSVVINKTTNTRIPDQKFSEHIKDDRADDFQKRYILKRDNSSFDREDGSIRMRLKADKRSKSMEEREEEYQRARERIFAHDGDHFILDRSAQEDDACMSTQQRRQMFRLRAGRSGASRQSSSETETLPRHGEPRPWSSTDSSDSSNRLAPRPAITKASSFSGISPSLVRGDSTASSKSTGRLSKTGSESCSSVGSSSSSLSRPQLVHPLSASSRNITNTPISHSDTRSSGHSEMIKSILSHPPPTTDTANYYVFPLEASGIPPGSVLVNAHAGKHFIHPDGNVVLYNPAIAAPNNGGRSSQQGKSQQQPIPPANQQQQSNHLHSQPICPPLQPSSEPVHNPMVSYPLPPSQFLPVCPNQQYTVADALNAQFSHMTLAQQPTIEGGPSASDARHYQSVYHHPSPVLLQGGPPQQVASYVVAGPSGGHPGVLPGQPVPLPNPGPPSAYPTTTPGPPAFTGPTAILQQHAYIQQPVQQVSPCYCSSAQHPHCSNQQQQYRPPVNPLPYNCPQSQNLPQQQVHQAVMPNPASSYQTVAGVQPTTNLALAGNQQSNMGNQMQGMMVQYPPIQSYQQVSVPQQAYQQPVFVSCQPGQAAVAVAGMQPCYGFVPPSQHTTMSSTVSFLPAPMMEQLQFPQNSSNCIPQQHPGQQYAGLLPVPPGSSMVMLQMAAPACQQPRALSPCQRKQPNHKHIDHQRGRRPADLPPPPDNTQSSLPSSPALTPSPGQQPSIKGLPSIISPISVMGPHHHPPLPTAFCHSGQGEAHFSLLGQPLQYKPSVRPPLIHSAHMVAKHQGPLGVWRGGHGRKASRKPLSSDLSVGHAVSSQTWEVTDQTEGISATDSHHLLAQLCKGGEIIQRLSDRRPWSGNTSRAGLNPSGDSVFSTLPSRFGAQNITIQHSSFPNYLTESFEKRTVVVSGVPHALSSSRMIDKLIVHFQSSRRSRGGDVQEVKYPLAWAEWRLSPLTELKVYFYVSSATLDLSVFGSDHAEVLQSLRSAHRSVCFELCSTRLLSDDGRLGLNLPAASHCEPVSPRSDCSSKIWNRELTGLINTPAGPQTSRSLQIIENLTVRCWCMSLIGCVVFLFVFFFFFCCASGSESCSSVGSSSSSLSRPQLVHPLSASSRNITNTPISHSDTRSSGHSEMIKSILSHPPPTTDTANYYVFPLEASGIPPGSVLVNAHAGKHFIHPDGNVVLYNPAIAAPNNGGRSSQQGKSQQQPIPPANQQQQSNHLHPQPICPPLQPSSEPVHNPMVSYPLPPSQFLPVCPNQQYTVADALNAQFSHMTLAQQPTIEGGPSASDARHYQSVYHHPSPVLLQGGPPQQVASYVVAGPSGGHPGVLPGQPVPLPNPGPPSAYPTTTPGPPAFTGPTAILQQHAYIQQPVQQVSPCYCSSAQHPHCSNQQQQYRPPVNPLPYNCPQRQNLPQQQVHQAVMPNPASSYQTVAGVQPTTNLALAGNQQSNMGNQMQGMMVQYPPIQSYQQVSVPQQAYQQPVFVSCQPGQAAVAVAGMQPCYGFVPPSQHTTMSSTVSFLPAPMMEQLQFPQNSSNCIPQQHPGQQYAGLLPVPPGSSMVMLQMAAPACQQPRALSPCQRKQPNHKHIDHQRGRRPADLPPPPDNTQSSLPSSPALTPSPGQQPSIKGLPSIISPISVMGPHHHPPLPTAFCHSGQGEAHFSLLGQPLQYKPSVRPPLIHSAHMVAKHQGPLGVWRGGHGRKASRKPLSSDLSVGHAVSSQTWEVTDQTEGISATDSHHLLAQLCKGGEIIQRLSDRRPWSGNTSRAGLNPSGDSVFSTLPSRFGAQNITIQHSSSQTTFKLRTSNRHKGELCDLDKASL
ncbi:R3H domain-containing protein 1-like [Thalassophryne amazonica]|uniref:R3H domain-containing protein 1-like n=1 Tax=Thalassophryne amazonica TaxID=390379 RepID=UPI001471ED20|nr:R3H domain-containing protein 1-like [Thalassophryne amazonica]